MSYSWNKVSLAKEEPKLIEIMSEELCNRLHVNNNFVWIDISEAQQVNNNVTEPAELESEFEFITKEDSSVPSALTVADIVQFTVKGEGREQNYYENDNDYYEWDERKESDYFEEFDHVRVKPVEFPKLRYQGPHRSKHKEHDTKRNYRSDKTKDANGRNTLLPKIIFDASTTAILEKFIKDTYLGQCNDVIGRGRNSLVFHAYCGSRPFGSRRRFRMMPRELAVKVYKIGSNEEHNKLVYKRAQREFDHLDFLYARRNSPFLAPRLCPWPIVVYKNVIIMSCIGCYGFNASPSIQDIPFEKDHGTYHAIIDYMDRCYNMMRLVHGKLSPKNILYRFETPYFIGWSHSVRSDHPQALSKLMRDCKFVTEFYAQRGVMVQSTEDLFKNITKVSKLNSKLLNIINKDLYKKYDTNPNRTPSLTEPNNNGTLRFK